MNFEILFEELGSIGLVTLNRPKVLNALNHSMFLALDEQLTAWASLSKIKAVVIQAAEGRAFSAGGDIRHAYERGKANDLELIHFFRDEYRLNLRIFHYPKPYIAFLNGITMGGGAGISINGSYRIATENLVFAMPETGIGFFPDVGASYFLSRLPHKMGFYLGLTGARISAADCLALGLANDYVEPGSLSKIVSKLSEINFSSDPKQLISACVSKWRISHAESELITYKNEIDHYFSKKTIEDILAALISDGSEWCIQTAKVIQKKSPISLKVTLRALQEGLKLDFDSCMKMEYRLTQRFLQGHDFYEGVRAAIIHKDQNPQWEPNRLEAISEQDVMRYFTPLEKELI